MKTALILTTLDSRAAAEKLARELVETSWAACVSILGPVQSVYQWKSAIENDEEFLLLIKRPENNLAEFEKNLNDRHPYDTPEILIFAADHTGNDYLSWLLAMTQSTQSSE